METAHTESGAAGNVGPGCASTRSSGTRRAAASQLDAQLRHILGLANTILFGEPTPRQKDGFRREAREVATALHRALELEGKALRDAELTGQPSGPLREVRRRHSLRSVDVSTLLEGAQADVSITALAELTRAVVYAELQAA